MTFSFIQNQATSWQPFSIESFSVLQSSSGSSQLLPTPPCPCSDPSSSLLGAKGWHNATSLFLFHSSCFAAQDLVTLDTVFHSGRYFHDFQILSRFLACLGRNPLLVGGLLSATAESYISALKYIVFAWAHAICIVPHQRHPLHHLIVPSLQHLQTSIGIILYTFLSWIWMSWAKSTTYQWLFTFSITSQDLLVTQLLILLIRSMHIFYHSMAWTKMAWRSQINYIKPFTSVKQTCNLTDKSCHYTKLIHFLCI